MSEVYFKNFKLPKRAWHFWELLHKTKGGDLYYLHTSGRVFVHYASGIEKEVKRYVIHNRCVVKIEGKLFVIKQIVAQACFNYYNTSMVITHNDGNIKNCDVYNLSVYTKECFGKITGTKRTGVHITIENVS